MLQLNFWQKYKIPLVGLFGAIIIGLLPVLQPGMNQDTTIAVLIMAVITAAGSWFAKNLRGVVQSIVGIIVSSLVMILPVVFAHGQLDWKSLLYSILSQVAIQFYAYSAAPMKPATYETNAVIVQAKEIPPVQQVVDNTTVPIGNIPEKKSNHKGPIKNP